MQAGLNPLKFGGRIQAKVFSLAAQLDSLNPLKFGGRIQANQLIEQKATGIVLIP